MGSFFRDAGSFAASEAGDVVRVFVVGPIQTNCYAYLSAGEALVVDPGAAGARVAEALAGEKVVGVAATHGHGDHRDLHSFPTRRSSDLAPHGYTRCFIWLAPSPGMMRRAS